MLSQPTRKPHIFMRNQVWWAVDQTHPLFLCQDFGRGIWARLSRPYAPFEIRLLVYGLERAVKVAGGNREIAG